MLGQTSISRGQGPQTPTHSKSEVKTKRPCEAKTKKPTQLNAILKTYFPSPTSITKTCFFKQVTTLSPPHQK